MRSILLLFCVLLGFAFIKNKKESAGSFTFHDYALEEAERLDGGDKTGRSSSSRAPASVATLTTPPVLDSRHSSDPLLAQLEQLEISKAYRMCEERENNFAKKIDAFAPRLAIEPSEDDIQSFNTIIQRAMDYSEFWLGRGELNWNGESIKVIAFGRLNENSPLTCPMIQVVAESPQGLTYLGDGNPCIYNSTIRDGHKYFPYEAYTVPTLQSKFSVLLIPMLDMNSLDTNFFAMRDSEPDWHKANFHWAPTSEKDFNTVQDQLYSDRNGVEPGIDQEPPPAEARPVKLEYSEVRAQLFRTEISHAKRMCKFAIEKFKAKTMDALAPIPPYSETSDMNLDMLREPNSSSYFSRFSATVAGNVLDFAVLARSPKVKEPSNCWSTGDGWQTCDMQESAHFRINLFMRSEDSKSWIEYPHSWNKVYLGELRMEADSFYFSLDAFRFSELSERLSALMISVPTQKAPASLLTLAPSASDWVRSSIQWVPISDSKRQELLQEFDPGRPSDPN